MKHIRYPSIENSYRQKFIEKIVFEGHGKGLWCVKEKVHGANFSINMKKVNDNLIIELGKRSAYLRENENFHNAQKIVDSMTSELNMFYHFCKGYFDDNGKINVESVRIFGEICGGNYPHPDVEKVSGASQVQKGVFYSPKNEILAFDLMINDEFISTDEADCVFHKIFTKDFKYLSNLFVGTLNECLAYQNEYQTTIPEMLGLPEIENNICEGNIIKPYDKVLYLIDGSRVVIKNKNTKFSEKSKNPTTKKTEEKLPEHLQNLVMELSKYCNEQRLANVISKLGEVTMKDFGKIMGLMNADVLEDFNKDFEDSLNSLDKAERKIVTKKIGKFNAPLIKIYMMENI